MLEGFDSGKKQTDPRSLYVEMAKVHHPDKGGNEEKMKELNGAYDLAKKGDSSKLQTMHEEFVGSPETSVKIDKPMSEADQVRAERKKEVEENRMRAEENKKRAEENRKRGEEDRLKAAAIKEEIRKMGEKAS